MSVKKKGRRKITIDDNSYVWYVELDDDSPYYILNIVSEDKRYVLSCPIKTDISYLFCKGNYFKNNVTDGKWNRYLLPFYIPDIITPAIVSQIIIWATQSGEYEVVDWNGSSIPV